MWCAERRESEENQRESERKGEEGAKERVTTEAAKTRKQRQKEERIRKCAMCEKPKDKLKGRHS